MDNHPGSHPNLDRLRETQLSVFPEHENYLAERFSHESEAGLHFADEVAAKILQIAGKRLADICRDYHWLTGMVLEEELHFRRTGNYRLSTFKDALEQVYSNTPFMTKYMNGLLLSQVWWRNHTDVLRFFRDVFLVGNPAGFSHLEIGPGHGLFLQMAASAQNCGSAEGWDISKASLSGTREALTAMGNGGTIVLREADIFRAPKRTFQSITFSEVLEHLEQPSQALAILRDLLAPGGRLFVNAPVNSPAPDHISLFRTPEEIVQLVEQAGLKVENTLFAPCTGSTLERARKRKLSISTAVIAVRN